MQIGAAYIRVSTDDQTEYSLDAQIKSLKEYSKKNNILLSDEFVFREEGVSGRQADKRPEFQKMISLAKKKPKPFDVILVHKFDRFARNREDSVVYKSLLRKECGIRVVSITEPLEDDKMSVLIEALLEAMAEYYSMNLADEVLKGLKEKASRGERCGRGPLGYDTTNGKLYINEKEAEIVKMIFNMYETESPSAIARCLNTRNIKTKTGKSWFNKAISYILENPTYKGYMRYNYCKNGKLTQKKSQEEWIIVQSDHEPIIDERTFDQTQKKLEIDRMLTPKYAKNKMKRHWLQHLMRCADCGSTLSISSGGAGGRSDQFRCPRQRFALCSSSGTISANKLESLVLNQINDDFSSGSEITVERIDLDDNLKGLTSLKSQLSKAENKMQLAKSAFLNEIDTMDEYKENKIRIKKEQEEIIAQINALSSPAEKKHLRKSVISKFIDLLKDDALSHDEKFDVAKQFIKEIRYNLKVRDFEMVYYV